MDIILISSLMVKYIQLRLMRNPEIDKILHQMAQLFQNIGVDSTEEERDQAKQQELMLIGKISQIDPEYALRLHYD